MQRQLVVLQQRRTVVRQAARQLSGQPGWQQRVKWRWKQTRMPCMLQLQRQAIHMLNSRSLSPAAAQQRPAAVYLSSGAPPRAGARSGTPARSQRWEQNVHAHLDVLWLPAMVSTSVEDARLHSVHLLSAHALPLTCLATDVHVCWPTGSDGGPGAVAVRPAELRT